MNKMKVADKFEAVRALLRGEVVENFTLEDAQNFLTERKEIAMRKNASNGERKPTKEQIANIGIKESMVRVMAELNCPITIDTLQKSCADMAIYSGQKLTALMTQLVRDNVVDRTEVKGKAHFALASKE